MRTLCFNTILLSVLACMMSGCNSSSKPVIKIPTAGQIVEFTNNAHITLPASSIITGYIEMRGMDDALWLQVRMPASDLQNFLDNSPFRATSLTTNDQYRAFEFQDFLPKPPLHYRAGQQELPNARVLNMIIDESTTTNVVVYLMWHET